ncbi:zinc finger MYM-type protein 1-like protein [Tanacetum coccineum]
MSSLSPRALFSMFDSSKLINLITLYPDDFTDSDRFHLMRELDLYHVNVVQNEDFSKVNTITELAKELARLDKHKSFPMIYKLLKLALVLPVATATVERCFSTMKLIKSDLRNRTGNRFLNHALICSIEKEVFINVTNEDVMKRFQSMRDRKGKLI